MGMLRNARARRQQGAGIVEVMVGVLIGMIVVLVVYNLLSASEGYRRMTAGVSDSQVTGLFSQFTLGREAANAGNGIGMFESADALMFCADLTLRPIPLLIRDSTSPDFSDAIDVFYSGAPRVVWPVNFNPILPNPPVTPPGQPFQVQSPNGFSVNDLVIAINRTGPLGTNTCGMYRVTNAVFTAPGGAAASIVTLDYVPVPPYLNHAYDGNPGLTQAKLLNLGPAGTLAGGPAGAQRVAQKTRFDVCHAAHPLTPCAAQSVQLRSLDLLDVNATPVPIAQNVVLMKVQYGIDTSNPTLDQIVDCWTPADNSNTCGNGVDYSAASVLAMDRPNLNRIVAVRIGIVTRSDEPDPRDPTLVAGVRPPEVLFNCSTNNAACQSRIVLSQGNNPNDVIQDGFRYRIYETVIPMRNAIFNAVK